MRARFLKLWAYSTFFWLVFSAFFYLTFPIERVKGILIAKIEEGLGKGKQGTYGVDPKVTIESLSMWRLSGLDAKRVSVQLASRDPDPGPTIELDWLRVRVGVFSLLTDDKTIAFSADLYDGEADGVVARIEARDVVDAATSGEQPRPRLLGRVAERADHPDPGHDHPAWTLPHIIDCEGCPAEARSSATRASPSSVRLAMP